MDPRMWRELAEVTARTAFYLLWKVSRDQERFLRAGRSTRYRHVKGRADVGNYLLIKLPSVSTKILDKNLLKTVSRYI